MAKNRFGIFVLGDHVHVLFISKPCSVLRALTHEFYPPQAGSHVRESDYLQSRKCLT